MEFLDLTRQKKSSLKTNNLTKPKELFTLFPFIIDERNPLMIS